LVSFVLRTQFFDVGTKEMYAYSRRPFRVQYAVFQGQTLHHRCVAGVLQCVAVRCSVLQCVAML